MKDLYGLVGRKLSHSYSADFFNNKFGVEHIDAEYCLFPLSDISELPALIASHSNLKGLNVTIPYKESVIPCLTGLSPAAEAVGAVNVISIVSNENGEFKLYGDNTDVYGFRESVVPLLSSSVRNALVLGTGGASKAVCRVLSHDCRLNVVCVSRTPQKHQGSVGYNDVTAEFISGFQVIVNTTPLGMYPNVDACPPIPYEGIAAGTLCYDLVYNPELTLFLQRCSEQGARVKNGLEMLRLQAIGAWKIWSSLRNI